MSTTVIESADRLLLTGFMHAMLFTTDSSINYDQDFTYLIITHDNECDNQTYTLTEDGLELKHTGVKI